MDPQTLIDNEFATLMYYPDDKLLHHQFHKSIAGQAFRDFMTASAEAFVANGCKKYLSDDRGNTSLEPEDRAWGDVNFTPPVVEAGWKYWALVMPQNIIGMMDMRALVDEYMDMGVVVQIFSDPDQAMAWLRSRPTIRS